MSIKILKLVDGSEVVAEAHQGAHVWTLTKVAVIQAGEDPANPGRVMLGIAPGIPLAQDPFKAELKIDDKHVLYAYEPNAQLVSVHRQTFSAIIQPDSNLSSFMDKNLQ